MVHADGSWARATGAGDDTPTVHQGGPRRLWDILDGIRLDWLRDGSLPVLRRRRHRHPRRHHLPPARPLAGHPPRPARRPAFTTGRVLVLSRSLLTELAALSSQFTGQIPSKLATVSARVRRREARPGSRGLERPAGRRAGRDRQPLGALPAARPGRGAGPGSRGVLRDLQASGPVAGHGPFLCDGPAAVVPVHAGRPRCRGTRRPGPRPATSAAGSSSPTSRPGRTAGSGAVAGQAPAGKRTRRRWAHCETVLRGFYDYPPGGRDRADREPVPAGRPRRDGGRTRTTIRCCDVRSHVLSEYVEGGSADAEDVIQASVQGPSLP